MALWLGDPLHNEIHICFRCNSIQCTCFGSANSFTGTLIGNQSPVDTITTESLKMFQDHCKAIQADKTISIVNTEFTITKGQMTVMPKIDKRKLLLLGVNRC